MRVIAAFGQLANGKDCVCDKLAEILNKDVEKWHRRAFANTVKDLYCKCFGVDREFIEKWKRIPECPPGMLMPVRQALQFIGDGFRQIKSNIWIEMALNSSDFKIIADGRYFNEAIAIHDIEGYNILVYRQGYLNDDPNPSESQMRPLIEYCSNNLLDGEVNFESLNSPPNELQYFDFFIRNDSDLEGLYKKVNDILVPSIKKRMQINDQSLISEK